MKKNLVFNVYSFALISGIAIGMHIQLQARDLINSYIDNASNVIEIAYKINTLQRVILVGFNFVDEAAVVI